MRFECIRQRISQAKGGKIIVIKVSFSISQLKNFVKCRRCCGTYQVITEAVSENSQGYLLVNNDPIMWTMLNAIKELKTENDLVKSKNGQLKHELMALKDRQSTFEDMLLALSTDLPKEKLAKLSDVQL